MKTLVASATGYSGGSSRAAILGEGVSPDPWQQADWLALLLLLALAGALRLVFYSGFFGSDELNYVGQAAAISRGDWTVSDYIGSVRYGMNLPNALFISLFGVSEFSGNFWPFLCSLGEVGLVYFVGRIVWGFKAAVLSSVVMATMPLHVHQAGRMMADPPLALFLTLSFVLFFLAERRQRDGLYLAAGLAGGFVFWIKEVVIVYLAFLLLYALAYRTVNPRWLWLAAGAALMIALNCVLMWVLAGDPMHIYKVTERATSVYITKESAYTSHAPSYYFRYMFVGGREMWLTPYFAVAGIAVWLADAAKHRTWDKATGYVVLWAVGLLVIFSFGVFSLNPLKFIAKQQNYVLIFTAPIVLLAGFFLSRLRGAVLGGALAVLLAGFIVLAAVDQNWIRLFTANSKAALAFAKANRETPSYGIGRPVRAARFAPWAESVTDSPLLIRPISELAQSAKASGTQQPKHRFRAYVIVDLETIRSAGESIKTIEDVPRCWEKILMLEPRDLDHFGGSMLTVVRAASEWLPETAAGVIERHTDYRELLRTRPRPAYVFGVPPDCEQGN